MTRFDVQSITVAPMDEANQTLIANVHPPDWVNPTPQALYDLVVIGAGTAGLVVAAGAAGLGLGLKVALVERHLMGGDCLNVGCVPSKCIIRSARAAIPQDREALGVMSDRPQVDFSAVMARMRRIRAEISPNDSAQRFQKLGVDVFLGDGCFVDGQTLQVGETALRFKKAVIATGARATKPAIAGIEAVGYLTNETVFSLTDRPNRLAVIGGGPIGCELAQAFQRLGCQVVLFHKNAQLLNKEDSEAAEILRQSLVQDGVRVVLNAELQRVEQTPEGKMIHLIAEGKVEAIAVDEILAGAGRAPNVEGLNLEAIGVAYDSKHGVQVNDYLQTSNPKVYAAGDICMDWKFTHAADAAARIVIKNTLFSPFGIGRSKLSSLVMPWVTYTDPEIAHVGLYESEARDRNIAVDTIKIPFKTVDRALIDHEAQGFLKILHQQGSDKILGATIVASHAGDMISEITTAIVHNIGLSKLSSVIHPYPTQAEAIKKAADAYRRTLLTPRTKAFLGILTKLA
ncbi:MAG: mercuric reductase [Drouetiella hepatica Uher 2000/2452]|jgi:pyruvate/2-oxoglutarate dehydrogenase complex dihydrolipoamide dehydrogenase (E3) component|uniref:Mercuric reductase n=1 Tax=Drouetiella hepatica Uher 2000/2452 TaxID=904376 RepID=A0A951Q8N0_9CYAN|nr:mercuric reductase [Drouetiella hepatica Uher 2000/2452]